MGIQVTLVVTVTAVNLKLRDHMIGSLVFLFESFHHNDDNNFCLKFVCILEYKNILHSGHPFVNTISTFFS